MNGEILCIHLEQTRFRMKASSVEMSDTVAPTPEKALFFLSPDVIAHARFLKL